MRRVEKPDRVPVHMKVLSSLAKPHLESFSSYPLNHYSSHAYFISNYWYL